MLILVMSVFVQSTPASSGGTVLSTPASLGPEDEPLLDELAPELLDEPAPELLDELAPELLEDPPLLDPAPLELPLEAPELPPLELDAPDEPPLLLVPLDEPELVPPPLLPEPLDDEL
jgi:hypothetical protein